MYRVCIVGGGFFALNLAHVLRRLCPIAQVTVIERASQLGGSISTVKAKSRKHPKRSYIFECGDPHLKSTSLGVCHMLEKLGLDKKVVQWNYDRTKLLGVGYTYHLPPRYFVPNLTRGGASSWITFMFNRLRFMREIYAVPRSRASDLSVWDFVERRFRNRAITERYHYKTKVEHMGDSRKLSMRSCYPEDWKKEQLYGSLTRGDVRQEIALSPEFDSRFCQRVIGLPYVTLRNGMQTLTETMEKSVAADQTHDELIQGHQMEMHGIERDPKAKLGIKDQWKLSAEQRANLIPFGGEIPPAQLSDDQFDYEPQNMTMILPQYLGKPVEVLKHSEVIGIDFSYGSAEDTDEVSVKMLQFATPESAGSSSSKSSIPTDDADDATEERVEVTRVFDHVITTTSSFDLAKIFDHSRDKNGDPISSALLEELRSIEHRTSYRVNFAWPFPALDRSWLGYRPPVADVPYMRPAANPASEHRRQVFQAQFPPAVDIEAERDSDVAAVWHDSGMFPQLNRVQPDETRISLLIRDTENSDAWAEQAADHAARRTAHRGESAAAATAAADASDEPSADQEDAVSSDFPPAPGRTGREVMQIAAQYVRGRLGIKAVPDAAHLHVAANEHPQFELNHHKKVKRIDAAVAALSPSLTVCSKSIHGPGFASGLMMGHSVGQELSEAIRHATIFPEDPDAKGLPQLNFVNAVDFDLGYNPQFANSGRVAYDGSAHPMQEWQDRDVF